MPDKKVEDRMYPPQPTDKTTRVGRPVYLDQDGNPYSEKTVTFRVGEKWYSFPSVIEDGVQLPPEEVVEYVKENGPVDPITGERFPAFNSVDEAVEYAEERSRTLMSEEELEEENDL